MNKFKIKDHMVVDTETGESYNRDEALVHLMNMMMYTISYMENISLKIENGLYNENQRLKKENEHFRKVFGNKYDAYINGTIGGNVNEL